MHPPRASIRSRHRHRGFTLLESLMASAILFGIVTAVTSAVVAGQQHALEAQQYIGGTLAAEALLGRILTDDYADLASWNGFTEEPGAMTDQFDQAMPQVFGGIGRRVTVVTTIQNIDPPNVNIRGRLVTVLTVNSEGRVLVELTRFVAEPPEDTL